MRLTGWQRLGILASCGWVAYWLASGVQDAALAPDWRLSAFVAAFYAIVPLCMAWIAVWIVLRLARWVWRGFVPDRRHVDQ